MILSEIETGLLTWLFQLTAEMRDRPVASLFAFAPLLVAIPFRDFRLVSLCSCFTALAVLALASGSVEGTQWTFMISMFAVIAIVIYRECVTTRSLRRALRELDEELGRMRMNYEKEVKWRKACFGLPSSFAGADQPSGELPDFVGGLTFDQLSANVYRLAEHLYGTKVHQKPKRRQSFLSRISSQEEL